MSLRTYLSLLAVVVVGVVLLLQSVAGGARAMREKERQRVTCAVAAAESPQRGEAQGDGAVGHGCGSVVGE